MNTITKMAIKGLLLTTLFSSLPLHSSDHDDGERALKGRNLNLTDLYVFNEASQTGRNEDAGNLVLVMNTNPRSLPEQQYYFSTKTDYEFHISRAAKKTGIPTGEKHMTVSLRFSEPDASNRQAIFLSILKDGKVIYSLSKKSVYTTNLINSQNGNLGVSNVKVDKHTLKIFAGHREDPFFFDVEQFFKVRGAAVKTGALTVGFSSPETARDFTKNYNVNSIVISLPIALIEKNSKKSEAYDVWETISVDGVQLERLGRPAVNEGLLVTNDFLNAFNQISPARDLDVGNSTILKVLKEASASLDLFDSLDGKEHFANGFDSEVVKGFLPDVMRIDPYKVIPVGTAGYNGDFVINTLGAPMLTGGRKIEDDVVDITLSYLIAGDPSGSSIKDNVSYEGTPGNVSQGHKKLHGQASYGGAATFPFLAEPH